jgi:DNA-3-methyladenine glycosylase II
MVSDDDVVAGLKALRRKCPHIRKMYGLAGVPAIRRREPGFEGLSRIIVAQQLSVASAAAIWARTAAAIVPFDAPTLLTLPDDALRGAGLSAPKIRTLRAIATAVTGGLDLESLDGLSDEEVHAALTQISGVGPWTADIFLMFCLGRADAFAAGDLALQVAAQMALDLKERPTAAELLDIAERWRPWRNVAALMLWAYYKAARQVKTAVPV